jgi:uncharacterized membrane protein YgcG
MGLIIGCLVAAIVAIVLCYRYRFMRIICVAAGIAAVVFFPVVLRTFNAVAFANAETSVIDKYVLEYDLAANGDLTTVETLDVAFTETKHGIFRIFDENSVRGTDISSPVAIQSVQRCDPREGRNSCEAEPYTTYYEDGFLVAKIGSAAVTYPAGTVNRYRITSSTSGVITVLPDATTDQWYWNVIGAGWDMPIDSAVVRAQLPVEPVSVQCITDSGACAAEPAAGSNVYSGSYTDLPPRTPVTWQAQLPPVGLTAVAAPGTPWWKTPVAAAVGAALALLLAVAIWMLSERRPSTAPVFAAPGDDILPLVWTLREEPADEPFQTMLLQLTQLGVLSVEVDPSNRDKKPSWVRVTREDKEPPADLAGADDFLGGLDLDKPGDQLKITTESVTVGEKVQSTRGALSLVSKAAALRTGYFSRSALGLLVHLFAAAMGPVALIVLIFTKSPWFAVLFLIPGVVGIFSNRQLSTRLTEVGLAMRDQVSGLRTALSTPASVERFDYSLKARYFAQFLPWAVALNCADKWAEACKPPPDAEIDPGSPYYMATSQYYMSQAVSTAVASVSAGAVAAYAATQSSSSGGGGGFSSGGGGGGGGGGSW